MKPRRLVLRGLLHYWRTSVGVAIGTAIGAATLVGALAVGDSVRYSLGLQAQARIGELGGVLASGDRFFRAELADDFGADADAVAPAVHLGSVASTSSGDKRLHDVQVLGIDARFLQVGANASGLGEDALPGRSEVDVNEELARRLELAPGDQIVLRVEKPSALPRDMALAPDDAAVALRVKVRAVVGAARLGGFALRATSTPPANAFVSLAWLQEMLEIDGRANLLVSRSDDVAALDARLREAWRLEDAELALRDVPPLDASAQVRELRTSRVFFDEPIVALLEQQTDVRFGAIFTYFVNALRVGERAIPYSMVAGVGALGGREDAKPVAVQRLEALLPQGRAALRLNAWADDDLGRPMESSERPRVELDYHVVDSSRRLVEQKSSFALDAAAPVAMPTDEAHVAWSRSLMPDFPGLADAENCRDWEPGTPVDLDAIRDQDEAYWDDFGGMPKAYLPLDAARRIWSSRFGALTALRFDASDEQAVVDLLRNQLDPALLGLSFRDVRAAARAAVDSPTDFGGLFIGLSFFLIVAAVLLTTQLFLFGIEQRSRELGLHVALGLPRALIARLFLSEALVIALAASVVGAGFGLAYTRLVLRGLATVWSDAVAGANISFHAEPTTVVIGAVSALATIGASVAFALWRRLKRSSFRLLASEAGVDDVTDAERGVGKASRIAAVVLFAGALALVLSVDASSGPSAAGAFFGAGAAALTGALLVCRAFLRGGENARPAATLAALGVRNATRRPSRSFATVATMAIGTFLVVAVGANRQGPVGDDLARSSGTGGFALYGRSSLPVTQDLESDAGRDAFGLDADELAGVSFVPLRVRQGDDASCLSLARASAPRLLGLDVEDFVARGPFTFADSLEVEDGTSPWTLLDRELDGGAVPAIGDTTSLTWQLHLGIGDALTYVDERGREFQVEIVGAIADTILQGDLVISDRAFQQRFPTAGGFQRFLVDVDGSDERVDEVAATLTRALSDVGLSLERTGDRLDAFHTVQNSYLSIFQMLGALGLLLGTVGLGMVVLRNTLERRAELAVATAVGFTLPRVRRLLFAEFGTLLALGLAAGVLASCVAIVPSWLAPGSDLSLATPGLLALLVAVNGLFWIAIATRLAVRRAPLEALNAG